MRLSRFVQAACQTPENKPPATLQERLRLSRRIFLVDAVWTFNEYLKRAHQLLLEMQKDNGEKDEIHASIMKEGSKPRASVALAFVSPSEIRLKLRDAAGIVREECILSDAQKQSHFDVAEWVQRNYEVAFSR